MLNSMGGPFPQVTFCPAGGVLLKNFNDYLALDNVTCVGGSWIVPKDSVGQEDWQTISALLHKSCNKKQVSEARDSEKTKVLFNSNG